MGRPPRAPQGASTAVLIGNPTQVAAVANSLGTVHRYSSAVIAFHPDDRPTPEQIAGVLADFEALAFAGLPADGYAWTAVQHGRPDPGTGCMCMC